MKDERKSEETRRGAGTKLMFSVWVISSIVFVATLVEYSRRYTPMFEAFDVAQPTLTVLLLKLADFVKSGQGMIVALVVQGVTLVPFISNRTRHLQPKIYAVLAITGLLALASIWFGLLRPIDQLQTLLAGG